MQGCNNLKYVELDLEIKQILILKLKSMKLSGKLKEIDQTLYQSSYVNRPIYSKSNVITNVFDIYYNKLLLIFVILMINFVVKLVIGAAANSIGVRTMETSERILFSFVYSFIIIFGLHSISIELQKGRILATWVKHSGYFPLL